MREGLFFLPLLSLSLSTLLYLLFLSLPLAFPYLPVFSSVLLSVSLPLT